MLTRTIYNTKLTPDLEFRLYADRYLLHEEYYGFISSGEEFAACRFLVDGALRVDGKLICGDLIVNGYLKINGEVEIDEFFTLV